MLEELYIDDLSDVHNDNKTGNWTSSNDRSRLSRYRESYCSDVDLLPLLCTKVTVDIHQDNINNSDFIHLAQKNYKPLKNSDGVKTKSVNNNSGSDDRSDDDYDDDENLMNWLLKQFRENGLDYNDNNLKNDDLGKIDALNYVKRLNHKTPTIPHSLQIDGSNSSISSYQATIDSKKSKTQNEHLLNNNNFSKEQCGYKQYHHFPRMYPPVRDSSIESRKLGQRNRSNNSIMTTVATTTTTNPAIESGNSTMLKTINDTKHQCELINGLFHQITKKLTCLHEFDERVINQLQNACQIINDLQKTVKLSETSLLNSLHYQLNEHFCQPKIFTSESHKTTNSFKKRTGVKDFSKKKNYNVDGNLKKSIVDEQKSHSAYSPELDCRSPVEKVKKEEVKVINDYHINQNLTKQDNCKSPITETNGRHSTQRKFTESPWGPISVQQAKKLTKDYDQCPKVLGQNNNNRKSNHLITNDNYFKWLKSSKSSMSNNNLDKLNESIYQTNDVTDKKSNLSNERYFSQLTLPIYSTFSSTKSHTVYLNTSREFNVSESNSNKFTTTKGIQSLFKLPFKRKASTPGPNIQSINNPLKSYGRSASLAQLHTSNENPSIMSISNDQLNKSTNKLNVPYIKPLLLKELSKI
uniref:Rho-GAP domain-containing protein n=1 Tax=Schistosoma mansoni TaxID=6183 RepID=A0A5K4EB14_SCHMA